MWSAISAERGFYNALSPGFNIGGLLIACHAGGHRHRHCFGSWLVIMVIDLIEYSIELSDTGEQILTFIFMLVCAYGVRAMGRDIRKWQRAGKTDSQRSQLGS